MSGDKFRVKARKRRLKIEEGVKKALVISEQEKIDKDSKEFQIYLKMQAYKVKYIAKKFIYSKCTTNYYYYINQLAMVKNEVIEEELRENIKREINKLHQQ